MSKRADPTPGSTVLLDEYFAAGEALFVDELVRVRDSNALAALATRWNQDPRPFARRMLFAYLARPMATPGHNVLVKRLFKHAEAQQDLEVLAAFVPAFERLVRRRCGTTSVHRGRDRQPETVTWVIAPRDNLLPMPGRPPSRSDREARLFSYRTRYHLRRRAWRNVRRLFHRDPELYRATAARVLRGYVDADFAEGVRILDARCLLDLCHRHDPALVFSTNRARLAPGRTLAELTPAPRHLAAWTGPAAAAELWALLGTAKARFVRVWTLGMLEKHHREFLATLPAAELIPLFENDDAETQQLAARMLADNASLGELPVATWLGLLGIGNPVALQSLCELARKHVPPERFTIEQLVRLASARSTPVAGFGLEWLRARTITTTDERAALAELSGAACASVAGAAATHALAILGQREHYDVALVMRFFDAVSVDVRTAAWEWLAPNSPGHDDPVLWARLSESPYEDVRLRLVKALAERVTLPGTGVAELTRVWTAVLLGIHRGGRHKILAVHQLGRALLAWPEHVRDLLGIVAVALRSVRAAEARVALAALVQAVERTPALAEPVARAFPELRFVSQGATS